MTVFLIWLVLYLVLHLPALGVCYWLWIQHERAETWKVHGGWRAKVAPFWLVFHAFGILGFLPDVFANYTTLAAIFWRWPGRAFTFSKHLWPLSLDAGWRGRLARPVAAVLDWLAPSGNHIHQ